MDPRDEKSKIWFDGKWVDWMDATIHVMSHVVHYGSSVFEGIRCYSTPNGPSVFRLQAHIRRLFDSAKIYRMPIPFSQAEIIQVCKEVVKINHYDSAYIRPIVFRGYKALGVDPSKCPVNVVVATLNWGRYLGEEALAQGVDVRVSSWTRMAPNTMPAWPKRHPII